MVAAPGTDLHPGQTVAAMMGGMGRRFDGSYAEYTRIPRPSVFPLETSLDWATLGALPEMFQTCNGSLVTGLRVERGQSLLIRGGTSSIGLTTAALAKQQGLRVLSTTRNPAKRKALEAAGVDQSDRRPRRFSGRGRARGRSRWCRPGARARRHDHLGGLVALCRARWHRVHDRHPGWIVDLGALRPFVDIPNGVCLTSYGGDAEDVTVEALQSFVDAVTRGDAPSSLDRTFTLDEIQEAHRFMEGNRAQGKLVVVL